MFPGATKVIAPFSNDPRERWFRSYAAKMFKCDEEDLKKCFCSWEKCHGWYVMNGPDELEHLKERDPMIKDKVEAKKSGLEKSFKEIQDKIVEIDKILTQSQQQKNALLEELLRLQGEYRGLDSLLKDLDESEEKILRIDEKK